MHTIDKTALLIVGHGTASEAGQREFWQVATQVAQALPGVAVEGCFLELVEPGIAVAIERLAARGADRVVVVPLLLFAAGHVKRDIPRAADQAAARCGISLLHAPALGNHALLVELSALRFHQALGSNVIDPDQIAWVLVGRGNRDPLATADFHDFLSQRLQRTPVGAARAAFLAMAQPRFAATADEVANLPQNWVIVQPHLLFAGELLQQLQRMVQEQDRASDRQRWLLAPRLGGDRRVAAVVVDRFRDVWSSQRVPGLAP